MLGAVGVANVVMMSVTSRMFEFGLRRALGCKRRWIFAQVYVEAAIVCVASGAIGFGLGAFGVSALGKIELPEGFAPPQIDWHSAWTPMVLLGVVTMLAAAWPATRAVRISLVQALAGGKL